MAAVPIIGMGAVSAAGLTLDNAAAAVYDGIDGLSLFTRFETGPKQAPRCAVIDASNEELAGGPVPNRTLALAICAVQQALASVPQSSHLKTGLVFATTVAGITRSERFYECLLKDQTHAVNAAAELAFHEPAALAGDLCRRFGLHEFHTISTACSTGLHSVGMAMRMIQRGRCDLCVAAGADALSLLTIRGFAGLLLLDPFGCRPFAHNRAGTSLGEGAGAIVLASEHAVKELAASPIALARGWGASADAHHMTAPHPQGAGAASAMRAALRDAALSPGSVDLIVAHGTGTPDNDAAEIKALQTVFGNPPPFCSMKRTLGHTLAASGILDAVFAITALTDGIIPATGGCDIPDPMLGAAPSPRRRAALRSVVKNAFGFGGNNASMVFGEA